MGSMKSRKIRAAAIMGVEITEVFSPKRVAQVAKRFGLTAGSSMDLTNGWDFNRDDHKRQACAKVKEEAPVLLIGSPPCTYVSVLQELHKRCTGINPAGWRSSRTRQPRPSNMLNFAVRFIVIKLNRDGIFSTSIRGQAGPADSQW